MNKHDCSKLYDEARGCAVCSRAFDGATLEEIKEAQEHINWRMNDLKAQKETIRTQTIRECIKVTQGDWVTDCDGPHQARAYIQQSLQDLLNPPEEEFVFDTPKVNSVGRDEGMPLERGFHLEEESPIEKDYKVEKEALDRAVAAMQKSAEKPFVGHKCPYYIDDCPKCVSPLQPIEPVYNLIGSVYPGAVRSKELNIEATLELIIRTINEIRR